MKQNTTYKKLTKQTKPRFHMSFTTSGQTNEVGPTLTTAETTWGTRCNITLKLAAEHLLRMKHDQWHCQCW